MPRVTCAACGAPSVLGASRCPKCLAPFGGASPTSGVVLVEPPPRPSGVAEIRRWLWLGLGALGLVGVGALLWSTRDRATVAPPGAPAPAEPAPADAAGVPSDTSRVASGTADTTPPVAVDAAAMSGGPAGAGSAGPRAVPPAPPAADADSGMTFAYETLTWVRVRAAPSAEAEVLATLAPGTRVEVSAIGRGWLSLRWEGRVGWVGSSLLTRVR